VEQLKTAIRATAHHNFTEGGVTTVSSMAILSCKEYLAEQELHAAGELPLRIRAIYVTPSAVNLDPVLQAGNARGTGNDMFRVGGVKIFADGARVGGGPIVLSAADSASDNHELARAANSRQIFSYTQDQLAALVGKIQLYGFPVQLHCLSEEGTELVTAVIEDVRRLRVGEDLRHGIEHWLPALPLAERMKDAGLGFSLIATQPGLDPTWPYEEYLAAVLSGKVPGRRVPGP
jgi:predicted amidohydrolase YtcJ